MTPAAPFPPARPDLVARLRDRVVPALAEARGWCAGKWWAWRAPLLVYLSWAGVNHLRDPEYSSVFGGLTFGIHELGHVVMSWGGRFITAAGGSFWQLAVPLAAFWMFLRQRDAFALSVAAAWFAFSLWGLATYVGDARAMELPLLGLSDDPEHDWNYLLGALGLLNLDTALAALMRATAAVVWLGALAWGGLTLSWMIRKPPAG